MARSATLYFLGIRTLTSVSLENKTIGFHTSSLEVATPQSEPQQCQDVTSTITPLEAQPPSQPSPTPTPPIITSPTPEQLDQPAPTATPSLVPPPPPQPMGNTPSTQSPSTSPILRAPIPTLNPSALPPPPAQTRPETLARAQSAPIPSAKPSYRFPSAWIEGSADGVVALRASQGGIIPFKGRKATGSAEEEVVSGKAKTKRSLSMGSVKGDRTTKSVREMFPKTGQSTPSTQDVEST